MPASLAGLVTFFTTTIPADLAAAGTAIGGALGGSAIADAAGAGLVDAGVGAGVGAAGAAATGQNPLKGAEFGGITGGVLGGFGPAVEGATGLGANVVDPLLGAGAGAIGGEVTGTSPLTGALLGGASGALSGGTFGNAPPLGSGSAGAGGGAGVSAAATAPPPGISLAGGDPTLGLGLSADSSIGGSLGTSALPGDIGSGAAGSSLTTAGLPSPTAGSGLTTGVGGAGASVPGALTSSGPIGIPSDVSSSVSTALAGGGGALPGAVAPQVGSILGASGTPAGTGGAGGGGGGLLGTLAKNPIIPLALGADLLNANRGFPGQGQLTGQAGTLAAQAEQLQNYETSGTLPPGVQGNLNAAGDAAKASIRAQYASRGMNGSSAEAQDLSAVDLRIQGQGEQYASQLFSQGTQDSQMSAQLYQYLMNEAIQQDNELGQSFGSLAGAMAMMSRPLNAGAG